MKPKKLDPISPINVLAGLKLNGKNPIIPPRSATTKRIASSLAPFNIKTTVNDKAEIAETPPARPSKPSIKLSALVTPIIQKKVRITDNTSFKPYIDKNGMLI